MRSEDYELPNEILSAQRSKTQNPEVVEKSSLRKVRVKQVAVTKEVVKKQIKKL